MCKNMGDPEHHRRHLELHEDVDKDYLPEGYYELKDVQVFTNDKNLVVVGQPDDESHNCDVMGCGMSHVLRIGRIINYDY